MSMVGGKEGPTVLVSTVGHKEGSTVLMSMVGGKEGSTVLMSMVGDKKGPKVLVSMVGVRKGLLCWCTLTPPCVKSRPPRAMPHQNVTKESLGSSMVETPLCSEHSPLWEDY